MKRKTVWKKQNRRMWNREWREKTGRRSRQGNPFGVLVGKARRGSERDRRYPKLTRAEVAEARRSLRNQRRRERGGLTWRQWDRLPESERSMIAPRVPRVVLDEIHPHDHAAVAAVLEAR